MKNLYRTIIDWITEVEQPQAVRVTRTAAEKAIERELYDEMDGSAAMDCPIEDLY